MQFTMTSFFNFLIYFINNFEVLRGQSLISYYNLIQMSRDRDDNNIDEKLLNYVQENNCESLLAYVAKQPKSKSLTYTSYQINNAKLCDQNRDFLPMKNLSLMHVAAMSDSFECFYILHQKVGLSVSIKNATSHHPIQYACFSDSLEIVAYICEVNPEEATFNFPLSHSLYFCCVNRTNNSDRVIKFLHTKGTEYPKTDEKYSPLKKCIMKKNTLQLIALLAVLKAHDPKLSLIMTALMQYEAKAIPFLIEAGEDPEVFSEDGKCAIELACFTNDRSNGKDSNYDVLKLMLENVRSIEPKKPNVSGPAHWICKAQSPQIAALFFNQQHLKIDVMRINENGSTGPSFLLTGCSNGKNLFQNSLEILTLFIKHGFDVNYSNKKTRTPSLLESYIGQIRKSPEMIKWLLNYGANPYVDCIKCRGTVINQGLNSTELKHIFEEYMKKNPPPDE
ncbi:hypothetical protein TRFO_20177 [Tritrichomonas foetus]|uniref:Uncharacterized protein n=1 Tax=Tritrichomonas foetus TaxID=1144522 RepID=A0A1J4KHJ7_9EUKA|nr:hypothetical protein TRFO_20177 [Tritrichomonas foetus]|eukprot:OHT10506.1 hypothetical protein TRFO_20177 [Tritrichomonas foetus]